MTSLQKVLGKIEEQYEKVYNNAFVWSDDMSAQFCSRFIFTLLAGTVMPEKSLSWFYNEEHHEKSPTDGIGGTVKNVISRNVKSGQVVVYLPLNFKEAVKRFVLSIHAVYLPQSEMIVQTIRSRRVQIINISIF